MRYLSSLLFFAIISILTLSTLQINAKPTPKSSTTAAEAAVSTTTVASTTKNKVKVPAKEPAVKPTANDDKKTQKPGKKSDKTASNLWALPNAAQKKLFNDYKAILHTKLLHRKHNITATYPLEPAKYGSQVVDKTILHHYLIKLPDSKYAHAIIGTNKDPKKPTPISADNASVRRTVYDNLAAAEA